MIDDCCACDPAKARPAVGECGGEPYCDEHRCSCERAAKVSKLRALMSDCPACGVDEGPPVDDSDAWWTDERLDEWLESHGERREAADRSGR